jgi:S-formylglutathione hydrolase FrmB
MGGYGALRLALGYPDTFAVATSSGGAVLHGSRNHPRVGGALEAAEFHRIFGDDPTGTDHDVLALAKRCQSAGKLPAIRIDCGTEDELIQDNRVLHEKLAALRVPHEYEEFSGAHDWAYWDTHVVDTLAFHARHLK